MENVSFDDLYMTMAFLVARKSKDPRTKVGAIIIGPDKEVISTGYNGFPRGCQDHVHEIMLGTTSVVNRTERPEKYNFFEHAERNAVYNAARIGVSTKDCVMYTNGTPCIDCARAVIQAGIKRIVVCERIDSIMTQNPKWLESISRSRYLFQECGVEVSLWTGHIVDVKVITDGVEYDKHWNGQGILI